MNHQPTPWTFEDGSMADAKETRIVMTGIALTTGQPDPKAKANAAFIVKAVNAHDDLVKALENLIGHESFVAKNFDVHYAHIEEAKAALRKAKGE